MTIGTTVVRRRLIASGAATGAGAAACSGPERPQGTLAAETVDDRI